MATQLDKLVNEIFDLLGEQMSPDLATRLLSMRPDEATVARLDELGDKANEGQLTDAERAEYDRYLWLGEVMAKMQYRAKRLLAGAQAA